MKMLLTLVKSQMKAIIQYELKKIFQNKLFIGAFVICLVATVLLGFTNKVTAPIIEQLAIEKNRVDEFNLYASVARLAPEIIYKSKGSNMHKQLSPNIDFYSGLVYRMLGLPEELYTPLFAIARISGWSAHRMEELINAGKIIRPAYKAVGERREYIPFSERSN